MFHTEQTPVFEPEFPTQDVYCRCGATLAPLPPQERTSSQIVVPVFGAISYDSLTSAYRNARGDYTTGPYPPISMAYRTDEGHTYVTRSAGCM